MSAAARIAYYTGVGNVGDRANADVVAAIGGVEPYQVYDLHAPHLLAIGSTFSSAAPNSIVWGTGVMHPDDGLGRVAAANVHAVRGKLTAETLAAQGVRIGDVPLGDPAVLLPEALGLSRRPGGERLGIVPHYVDRADPFFAALRRREDVVDLDVGTRALPDFLAAMAECAAIVSSSLHGLIFAEAMGIPNLWVAVADRIDGRGFKFRDWFSTTRRPATRAYRPTGGESPAALAARCRVHRTTIDRPALAAAFPVSRLDECRPTALGEAPLLGFAACRARPIPVFLDVERPYTAIDLDLTLRLAATAPRRWTVVPIGRHAAAVGATGAIGHAPPANPRSRARIGRAAAITRFFEPWAEPARYVIALPGVRLDEPDLLARLDAALDADPVVAQIVHRPRAGPPLLYRRAGRYPADGAAPA